MKTANHCVCLQMRKHGRVLKSKVGLTELELLSQTAMNIIPQDQ